MNVLRSPAVHMLVLGGLLFGVVVAWNGGLPGERPLVEIPRSSIAGVVEVFREEQGRSPNREELEGLIDELIDREVLFRYALQIGMVEDPTIQRRLAQIANFVAANPYEVIAQEERAQQAMELGLYKSDVVIRRILADGARRLIRAVVLTRLPTRDMLEDYLGQHRDVFMRPGTTRITHVMVNALAHGAQSEERAKGLLQRIQAEQIAPVDAVALGDEAFIPGVLPSLTDMDLERRFGHGFVEKLGAAPVAAWAGPLRSRYGYHLVFVHGRRAAYLPPFLEIEGKVRSRLLQKIADEWLSLRVQQLRAEFEIIVPEMRS